MPIPEKIEIRQLDLELNGSCNLKCGMCPQANGREKDFLKKLPWPVFEKMIEDAMQYGVQSVSLHGSGEPTLNQDMPQMVRHIKNKGIQCVSFTNGLKLNESLAQRLIEAEIDILRVSAVGYDRESYQRWMSKDEFELVRNNVRQFVALNQRLGGKTQVHLYHLLTNVAQKEQEIQWYRQNWVEPTGALAEIWMMHNWSGGMDAPYDRRNLAGSPQKRSCGRPFSPLLQVRAGGLDSHHGAVVACCMVLGKDSQGVLGHLDSQTIHEVVSGEPYQQLRAAHVEKRFDDIPYCRDCDQLYDFSESLVWTNIPGRVYGESKVAKGIDHRKFGTEQP
ncbi:MAG: radical SAM protein [Magnetococcales bacterium]|nr:radical SAM protein [Magnetococcales bacterium]MBF0149963.1 radical SAM protein [Magnetococcales bacterium]MBF0630381.1 radical SAM protein [Magnetococcales bacterium]